MTILHAHEPAVTAHEFRDVLISSALAERRPVEDLARLAQMLLHADIIITARSNGRLVGLSRAITDFAYCCYLSDLAVAFDFQRQGIGKRLIAETHAVVGEQTTLILVSAPAAETYYPRIGMEHLPSCWAIRRSR